jgi:diguanylate cyclase (GGDEF)-like protein
MNTPSGREGKMGNKGDTCRVDVPMTGAETFQMSKDMFENLLGGIGSECNAKRVYICEDIGPDSFLVTYEWHQDNVESYKLHKIFRADGLGKEYPELWNKEVIETPDGYMAKLVFNGTVIGFWGVEKGEEGFSCQCLPKQMRMLSSFVASLVYSWKMMGRLHRLGYRDTLTGAGNLNSLYANLKFIPKDRPLGVVFADISGLKAMNDTYGHYAGNQLLIQTAEIFFQFFGMDSVYRVGGDEFILLWSDCTREDFDTRMEDIRNELQTHHISVALGDIWVPEFSMDFSVLEGQADKKMYKEKRDFQAAGGDIRSLGETKYANSGGIYLEYDNVPSPFAAFTVVSDPVGGIKDIFIEFVNEEFCQFLGGLQEAWIGKSLMTFLHAPDRSLWRYVHQAVLGEKNKAFICHCMFNDRNVQIAVKMISSRHGTLVIMPLTKEKE